VTIEMNRKSSLIKVTVEANTIVGRVTSANIPGNLRVVLFVGVSERVVQAGRALRIGTSQSGMYVLSDRCSDIILVPETPAPQLKVNLSLISAASDEEGPMSGFNSTP
jgi:hypothetical protein